MSKGADILAKIAIVTDHDTGLGFRLAGVDVYSASSYKETEGHIEKLLKDKEYGLVAYSEEYTEHFPESMRIKMEESSLPVFIAIPSIKSWKEVEREEEYIGKILQKALGFYVKIKR